MSSSDELAHINYKLLKKARKNRGLSIIKASEGLINPEELKKAENEEIKIDYNIFKQLAKRYKRNICYFYLDKEPSIKLKILWRIERLKTEIVHYLIKKWKVNI